MNRLTLNVKKKYMILGSNSKLKQIMANPLRLMINNKEISMVKTMKYLGVMIDDKLDFDGHIDYINRKSCQKLGAK